MYSCKFGWGGGHFSHYVSYPTQIFFFDFPFLTPSALSSSIPNILNADYPITLTFAPFVLLLLLLLLLLLTASVV
jgi:hypothetical protein